MTTQPSRPAPSGAFEYMTTKKDEFVGWARKFSLFPYPFVTACCAMEFMSVSSTLYDTDRFGAALPRFTPRQSDLLMVVGTVTHKQAPILKKVYEQMCEPKWVIAWVSAGSDRRKWPGRTAHGLDIPVHWLRDTAGPSRWDCGRVHCSGIRRRCPAAATPRAAATV